MYRVGAAARKLVVDKYELPRPFPKRIGVTIELAESRSGPTNRKE